MQALRLRLSDGTTDAEYASQPRPFHIYSGRSLLNYTVWLSANVIECVKLTSSLSSVFDPKNKMEIFGPPGQSGNPEKILALGARIVEAPWKLIRFAYCLRRSSRTYSSVDLASLLEPDVGFVWAMVLDHVDAEVESFTAYCETIGSKILQHVEAALTSTGPHGGGVLTLAYTVRQADSILQLFKDLQTKAATLPKPKGDFSMRRTELLHDRDELKQEMQNALTHLVFQHGPTLLRKKQQMVTSDDYGNKFYDKFDGELSYFAKNVLCREIPASAWNYLFEGVPTLSPITVLGKLLHKFETMSASRGRVEESFSASMSAYEYEHFCSEVLKRAGWITRVTTAGGDQGIDVIATAGSIKLVVQCKLYSAPVGNAAVQEIIAGRAFEQADLAAVATNSTFTQSAKSLAAAANVILLHHDELPDLHDKLGLVLHSVDVEDSASDDSARQLAAYLESLSCRPIGEIVRKAKQDLDEVNDLPVPTGLDDPLFEQAVERVIVRGSGSPVILSALLKIEFSRTMAMLKAMEKIGVFVPITTAKEMADMPAKIRTMDEYKALRASEQIQVPER